METHFFNRMHELADRAFREGRYFFSDFLSENESLESALKRFKRKCQKDGIIGDIRRKEAYDKPSVAKKKKREAARKRARKRG